MNNFNFNKLIKILSAALALGFLSLPGLAQEPFYLGNSSNVAVSGTSTLHDWTIESTDAKCVAKFLFNAANELVDVESLMFSVPATSLKSGKSAMDKNTYRALKTETYETIAFRLTSVKKVKRNSNGYTVSCIGRFSLSGVVKEVELTADCRTSNRGAITCSGSYDIDMTDFNIEPPTFMMGMVTTGKEITVAFDLEFLKQSGITTNKFITN